jgi:hypothetical protein
MRYPKNPEQVLLFTLFVCMMGFLIGFPINEWRKEVLAERIACHRQVEYKYSARKPTVGSLSGLRRDHEACGYGIRIFNTQII